jgi:diguanylate cyclase (GGDEF)-like protein
VSELSHNNVSELKNRIAELEEIIKVLKNDLIHDSLTGLKTRKFFEDEAKVRLDSARRLYDDKRRRWPNSNGVSLILFDIDNFKHINDNHGHIIGDEVLRVISRIIRSKIRKGDIAARWGGEEISLILVGADEISARDKANEIRLAIELTNFELEPPIKITISAGIASLGEEKSYEEILGEADEALYYAKKNGRNRVAIYSEIMKENGSKSR